MRSLMLLAALAFGAVSGTVAAAPSGKLVLYTSQPNADAQATVDAFKQRYPDVEVEWIRDGTTKVMAKLRAEFAAGAPQPDVLLIADTVTMEGLKQEGRLLAYPEAPTDGYPEGLHDPDGQYFSTKLITTGIVYNNDAPMQPTSWLDLVKPEAKGLVAMPSPLTSGAATIHMDTLTSDPALGWQYYEDLAANEVVPQGGNGATFKAVAQGEKLYGMVIDYLPIREAAKGSPVDLRVPEGRRQRGHRAGRDPEHRRQPGSRQGLRRLPAVARGAGAGLEPGLSAGASRRGAAPWLPAARPDRADDVRSGRSTGQ